MAKANYEKPTSQLDLEARQKKDYVPGAVLEHGNDRELSDNGFVGVDPVYQNYANAVDQPMIGDSGAEAKVHKQFLSDKVDFEAGATPAGDAPVEDEEEEEEQGTPNTPPSGGSPTPPPSS